MSRSSIVIGYRNRADSATFEALGSWLAGLPLPNLQSREMAKVARSTNATLASTKFGLNHGTAVNQRVVTLANHNMSADARWRVKFGTTSGGAEIKDSGWMDVWRMAFGDILEWESATWWLGVAGDEYLRSPYCAMYDAGETYTARYLTIEIDDTANVDGYVQIGRLFAGDAFQPEYGFTKNELQHYWHDLSIKDEAESGADWSNEKRKLRCASFVLPFLSEIETAYLHEMQRLCGTTRDVVYMPFPSNPSENQRHGFLGLMTELSAIEYPYTKRNKLPLRLKERA